MSNPQNHHFLPVFFLKRWVGSDKKVMYFWKPHNKVVCGSSAPQNTGYKTDLYTLHGTPDDQKSKIETKFFNARIDDPAAIVLDKIITKNVTNLSEEDRSVFVRFILSLRARHPDAIEKIRTDGEQALRSSLRENPQSYDALRGHETPANLEGICSTRCEDGLA